MDHEPPYGSEALTIGDIGERRLVDLIASTRPAEPDAGVVVGIGDDAAVLSVPDGHDVVVSCDRVPEDLFAWRAGLIGPYELGQYAVRVNLSDLAAMGATPQAVFWLLSLPASTAVSVVADMTAGLQDACAEFSTVLAGGDSKHSHVLGVGMAAVGSVPKGAELRRTRANVGEDVFCAGELGLAAAALAYFHVAEERGVRLPEHLEDQLRRSLWAPAPLVDVADALRSSGACTSCIDNTDGLGRTFAELSTRSAVGLAIDADRLPLHPLAVEAGQQLGCDPVVLALAFGLDLSLIGTLARGAPDPHPALSRIGETTPVAGQVTVRGAGPRGPADYLAGREPFEHFRAPFEDLISQASRRW